MSNRVVKKEKQSNVGSTSYIKYKDNTISQNNNIHVAMFSEDLVVAWSESRYNVCAFEDCVYSPNDYINIRVCIVERPSDDEGKYICCMAMTEFSKNRYNQWEDNENVIGFDIYFNKNFAKNELGVDEKIIVSHMAALSKGRVVDNSFVYIDVLKNAAYIREVFFSDDDLNVLKKIKISNIVSNIIVRAIFSHANENFNLNCSRDHKKIAMVKGIIDQNVRNTPDIESISKAIGVSVSKLMKSFREIEKRTVGDYITEQKMLLAAKMLREGRLTISEVAYECGYEHPSNFTTAFKRFYGSPPRQFIKSAHSRSF